MRFLYWLRYKLLVLLAGKSMVVINGAVEGKLFPIGGDHPIVSNVRISSQER